MRFDIGGIVAKCFSCGNDEFAALQPDSARGADRLACTCCCTEVVYDDLLSQIGRAALSRRTAATGTDQFTQPYAVWRAPLS